MVSLSLLHSLDHKISFGRSQGFGEPVTSVSSPPSSTRPCNSAGADPSESPMYFGVVRDSDRKTTALFPSV